MSNRVNLHQVPSIPFRLDGRPSSTPNGAWVTGGPFPLGYLYVKDYASRAVALGIRVEDFISNILTFGTPGREPRPRRDIPPGADRPLPVEFSSLVDCLRRVPWWEGSGSESAHLRLNRERVLPSDRVANIPIFLLYRDMRVHIEDTALSFGGFVGASICHCEACQAPIAFRMAMSGTYPTLREVTLAAGSPALLCLRCWLSLLADFYTKEPFDPLAALHTINNLENGEQS